MADVGIWQGCGGIMDAILWGRRTGSYELSSFFFEGGAFSVFSSEEQMILHVKLTLGSASTTSPMPKSAKEGRTYSAKVSVLVMDELTMGAHEMTTWEAVETKTLRRRKKNQKTIAYLALDWLKHIHLRQNRKFLSSLLVWERLRCMHTMP
ncbi:hypothetical protein GW17_00023781 [Ensete ventricosum]|nr:hypothetical protein GW17_00023781 [Ensete ventricosum]